MSGPALPPIEPVVFRPTRGIRAIVSGLGSVRRRLATELEKAGVERPIFVCGSNLAHSPTLALAVESAERSSAVFKGSRPHTPGETVDDGVATALVERADGVIAVGGGSAIDCAKAIALSLRLGLRSFRELEPVSFGAPGMHADVSEHDQMPVFCIPTTLSMAEFTPLFGIRDSATRRKLPYLDRGLISATIFLDGKMASSTPGDLWAETGVKCLDDALFRYCSAGGDEPASDAIHELAILGLMRDLRRSAIDGDPETRQAVFMSAWLSLFPVPRSFPTIFRPWFSMVARHALGGAVELSHGIGSCVALPAGLQFHFQETEERQAKLAKSLLLAGEGDSYRSLLEMIDDLMRQLGVPTKLEQLHVPRDALELVLSNMVAEAPTLGPPERLRSTLQELW